LLIYFWLANFVQIYIMPADRKNPLLVLLT